MNTAPAGSWLPEPGDPQKRHRLRVAEPPAPTHSEGGGTKTPRSCPIMSAQSPADTACSLPGLAVRGAWAGVGALEASGMPAPRGAAVLWGGARGGLLHALSAPSTGAPCAGQCAELPGHLQCVPTNYSLPGPETLRVRAGPSMRAEGPGAAPASARHQHPPRTLLTLPRFAVAILGLSSSRAWMQILYPCRDSPGRAERDALRHGHARAPGPTPPRGQAARPAPRRGTLLLAQAASSGSVLTVRNLPPGVLSSSCSMV